MVPSRPTQADVARVAGVSRQVVSLVVRDDPRVAPSTREKVEEALKALAYRPNSAARTLAARRSGTVGILVPNLTNPFFGELTQMLVTSLSDSQTSAVIATGPDSSSSSAAVSHLISLGVDACVLASPRLDPDQVARTAQVLPTVVVTDDVHVPGTALVRGDSRGGTLSATRHLLDQGYGPVVFVAPDPLSPGDSVRLRTAGYLDAMEEASLTPQVIRVDGDARAAVASALGASGEGLGIVCHDDFIAVSCLMAIADAGLRPGRDVGVTGFDNSSISGIPGVSLTSIDQGLTRIVDFTLRTLDPSISSQTRPFSDEETVIAPRLVVRASSTREG